MENAAVYVESIMIYLYFTYHISLRRMFDSHEFLTVGGCYYVDKQVKFTILDVVLWFLAICGVYLYQNDNDNVYMALSEIVRFYIFVLMVSLVVVCFIEVFVYFIILKLSSDKYYNGHRIYNAVNWSYTIFVIAIPMFLCTVKLGIGSGTWMFFYIIESVAAIVLYIAIAS